MKQKLIKLAITLFITWLVCQPTYTQTNIVLQASDFPGLEIETIWKTYWYKGTSGKKGKAALMEALRQFVVLQGVKAEIIYGDFKDTDEAHREADFYSKSQASIFHFGSLNGSQNKTLADESWYSHDPSGTALLYRSGRTCILVLCPSQVPENRDKDIKEQIKIVELLAEKVDQKIPILEAQVTLKPEALEVSPGVLTAFVKLPAGYPVKNIVSATCDGAEANKMMLNDEETEMIMKFRRHDIEKALVQVGATLDIHFIVSGTWQHATATNFFRGEASIKKIVGEEKGGGGKKTKP